MFGTAAPASAQPGDVLTAQAIAQRKTTAPGDQFAIAVIVTLELRARGDGRSCGDRTARTDYERMWAAVPLDQVLSGEPVSVRFTAEDGTDVEVTISDAVRGAAP